MTTSSSCRKVESLQIRESGAVITLIAQIAGVVIAFTILTMIFTGKKADFADAATTGAQTTTVLAKIGNHHIHCQDNRDAADCIAGAIERHAERSVLWLGNSQLHAVNQWKNGETNSTPILFDLLKPHNLDLVTFSQPNANFQEHYVLFEYLRHKLPLNTLILPAWFDGTREEGLRPDVGTFVKNKDVAAALAKTAIGVKLLNTSNPSLDSQETAGISHTVQERVEKNIDNWLLKHSALWRERPQMRGELIFGQLYTLRNTLFGIKATSKRKVIRGRYQDNLAAMESILDTAAKNHINVLVYITPIRNDVEIPYVEGEYRQFKSDITALSARYGATYASLENLVPANLWGSKNSTSIGGGVEIDFMHFQAQGHKLLAAELERLIRHSFIERGEKG